MNIWNLVVGFYLRTRSRIEDCMNFSPFPVGCFVPCEAERHRLQRVQQINFSAPHLEIAEGEIPPPPPN